MFDQSQIRSRQYISFACASVVEPALASDDGHGRQKEVHLRDFFAFSPDASDASSIFAFQTGFYSCETTKCRCHGTEDLDGC